MMIIYDLRTYKLSRYVIHSLLSEPLDDLTETYVNLRVRTHGLKLDVFNPKIECTFRFTCQYVRQKWIGNF